MRERFKLLTVAIVLALGLSLQVAPLSAQADDAPPAAEHSVVLRGFVLGVGLLACAPTSFIVCWGTVPAVAAIASYSATESNWKPDFGRR